MPNRESAAEGKRFRDTFLAAMSAIIVLTTAGLREEARKIARALVESRLAACVNIIAKVESVYRWEDNVQNAEEWLLIIKTISVNFEPVKEAIRKLHSYELPECVSIQISDAEDGYLKWLEENTQA
jgi:periplasmic divalent cation tolerance protein